MSYQNIDLWNLKAEKNLINPIFQGFFFFFGELGISGPKRLT